MKKRTSGTYLKITTADESFDAYIPQDLPPEPSIDMAHLSKLHAKALYLIGKLDGFNSLMPDIGLFIYMYVRKEALLSSQIEGTQSSLADFLNAEGTQNIRHMPGILLKEATEVSHYIKAQHFALERIQTLPLSMRLIRDIHEKLLGTGRGSQLTPGEFRRSQNWIGGTRPGNALFVPPPIEHMHKALYNLEHFLHQDQYPTLIKAAIAHVQFETIHPFFDGNGRIGRLLITLLICHEGLLSRPLIYISLYLKQNRKTYYELLTRVRQTGDWETWIAFFLKGVIQTAQDAIDTALDISKIFKEDEVTISKLHKGTQKSAYRLFKLLQKRGIVSLQEAVKQTGLNYTPASNAFKTLETLNIAKEMTGKKRNRTYTYKRFVDILAKNTEPLPR